jgi:hypothetical protein
MGMAVDTVGVTKDRILPIPWNLSWLVALLATRTLLDTLCAAFPAIARAENIMVLVKVQRSARSFESRRIVNCENMNGDPDFRRCKKGRQHRNCEHPDFDPVENYKKVRIGKYVL